MADDENRGRRRPYSARSPDTSGEGNYGPKKLRTDSGSAHSNVSERPSTSASGRHGGGDNGGIRSGGDNGGVRGGVGGRSGGEGAGPGRGDKTRNRYEIITTRTNVDQATKKGVEGELIKLKANYFRLLTKPQWSIYHYHVDFEPDVENRRLRGGILSQHSQLFSNGYLFDGKQIFSASKLQQTKTVLQCKSKAGEDFTITIKAVGKIEMTDPQSLQVLNLIMRRAMEGLKLELVGRNFFDPRAKIDMREFLLQLWPGYETSIRKHEQDILLCSEITHKVMRTETVYDVLKSLSRGSGDYKEEFQRTVIGWIVLTDYNNKTYRINEVNFTMTPQSTFECKGKQTSFLEYYYRKYNIRIRDPNQPLLISKCKDKAQGMKANETVTLIPELCRATGLTDQMRCNNNLMRSMSNVTRMGPPQRIQRLDTFNKRLRHTPESIQVLRNWNMNLDENLVEINGRVIKEQNIVFKDKKVSAGPRADWSNAFRNNGMFITPSRGLQRWAVVSSEQNVRSMRRFLQALYRCAGSMGFEINNRPFEILIRDDRNQSYVQAIQECSRRDPQLIFCVVPTNNADRYNSIKKVACVELAIPTQVMTSRTVGNDRGMMSIATKVAIQMNCKLGYTPWMIEIPMSGLMTIGFDIAKSTSDRSKAYAALVATMDLKTNASFYSTVIECNAYDLMANSLWIMIMKALHQYQREHRALPAKIVLYRDGISSGSLKQVFEHEVKEIVEKLGEQYRKVGQQPMFAFIVVTKSMNTRFFRHEVVRDNPPPGTVVDDVVTLPEWYDFYLVSQHVNQGTVAPTSYNVLYSNIKLNPDRLQQLTYKMAHLYYNWSGTTRVPSVVQYAKKLATLVATNLKQIPHNALEKKFYYL